MNKIKQILSSIFFRLIFFSRRKISFSIILYVSVTIIYTKHTHRTVIANRYIHRSKLSVALSHSAETLITGRARFIHTEYVFIPVHSYRMPHSHFCMPGYIYVMVTCLHVLLPWNVLFPLPRFTCNACFARKKNAIKNIK